jgi:ribonuclease HII
MPTICGIDEAGRGPVIGPLVISGILIEEKDLDKLRNLKVRDSKLLTPKQREFLYKEIKKIIIKEKTIIIDNHEVDYALNSEELNLNRLEAVKTAMIINYLKPDKVTIDCPSVNIKSYVEYLKTFIKYEPQIKAEHKADYKYTEVSGASIIAKVTRDREIEKLKKKYKVDFGSGYPSDPVTQEFLKKNYDKYDFFRKTWSTYKNIAEGKKQKSLIDYK